MPSSVFARQGGGLKLSHVMSLWLLALKGGVRCSPTCEEHREEGLAWAWGGLGGQLLGSRGGGGPGGGWLRGEWLK